MPPAHASPARHACMVLSCAVPSSSSWRALFDIAAVSFWPELMTRSLRRHIFGEWSPPLVVGAPCAWLDWFSRCCRWLCGVPGRWWLWSCSSGGYAVVDAMPWHILPGVVRVMVVPFNKGLLCPFPRASLTWQCGLEMPSSVVASIPSDDAYQTFRRPVWACAPRAVSLSCEPGDNVLAP